MLLKEIEPYCDHFIGIEYLYDKVFDAVNSFSSKYSILEIGTRSGGTSLLFLKAIKESDKKGTFLVTVDPHGEMFYRGRGDNYGENYYRTAMYNLSNYCFKNDLNHIHYRLTSFQFFDVWNSCDFWYKEKEINKKFKFIYFDGDHSDEVVKKELKLFYPLLIEKGLFCIDDQNDINKYSDVIKEKPIHFSGRLFFKKGEDLNLDTNINTNEDREILL